MLFVFDLNCRNHQKKSDYSVVCCQICCHKPSPGSLRLHERVKGADGKKTQEIEIFYTYVGIVNIPSEEELELLRKEHYKETA